MSECLSDACALKPVLAVDGCRGGDPGRLELDWLEVQLNEFRKRKMQVWLSGHVPPTQGNYYPECYLRYAAVSFTMVHKGPDAERCIAACP